jgi:predicted O-methyltransferase YrrM
MIEPAAEQYVAQYTNPATSLLQEIAHFTAANHPHAHMLSGHVQGQLLSMISQLMQPANILEVGTFTGYSAICLAAGLVPGGNLTTIEVRADDAASAQQFFNKSVYASQIQLLVGNALEIIPTLPNLWDIVFIDADKTSYIDYYELILPKLKTNGLVIADNVLFHGQVLQTPITGKNTKAIQAFNEHVRADSRVDKVMLTVRDGLMLIRKK